ncbi:MAG: hypothetical protein P8Z81_07820, partial [Deinococcales bacterium]
MSRSKRVLIPSLLIAAGMVLLASCSGPASNTSPTSTPQDVATSLNAAGNDAQTVATGLSGSPGLGAIGGLPTMASLLSGGALPTGTYVWDPTSYTWLDGTIAPTYDLRLQWAFTTYDSTGTPTGTHTAVAQIHWISSINAGSQELPTDATVALTVDGNPMGQISAKATWQNTSCGTIAEPATVSVTGTLGTSGKELKVNALTLSIPAGSGTLSTTGDVTATAASKTMTLKWNASVDGATVRDPTTCMLSNFVPTKGSLSFGLTGPSNAISLAFDFSNVQLTNYGLTSAAVSNGSLTINNALAASFQGTLDDSNHDGSLGNNVIITFKGGTQESLEQFIQSPAFTTFDLKPFGQ